MVYCMSISQVCYGMVYGIGAKALGEQLGVDEDEAAVFTETFKAKYPGTVYTQLFKAKYPGTVYTQLFKAKYPGTVYT